MKNITLFIGVLVLSMLVMDVYSADWPQWRGINRDGISRETGLLKSWGEEGPKLIWTATGSGSGFSSPSVYNGHIYVTGIENGRESLSALDLNGNLKWKTEYGQASTQSFPEARSTPTVDGNYVYVISGRGEVVCLDAQTGAIKWSVQALKQFEANHGAYGIAESPLIVDDKVIYTPCGRKTTVVALNKYNGEVVWASESIRDQSGYVSPILAEIGGKKQIITVTENHVIGVDSENGKIIWKIANTEIASPRRQINCVSPIYFDGAVFVTSGYNDSGALIRLSEDGTKADIAWINPDLDTHHGGVVLVDGYIYGSNWINNENGNWVCLDWNTGKTMYETKWKNKGSIISADGMLYCYEEQRGSLGLVRATPEGFNVISSFNITYGDGPHWAHPVISDSILYIRHGDVLMAYNIKAQ